MFDFGVWTRSLASLRNHKSILNVLNPEKLQDANFFFFSPPKQSWMLQMSSFAASFPAPLPHLQYKETSSRLLFSCHYFKRLLFGVFLNSSGNAFKWNEWYGAVLTAKWTLHTPVESSLILFEKPWGYSFSLECFLFHPSLFCNTQLQTRSLCPAAQRDPDVRQMVLYLCLITE